MLSDQAAGRLVCIAMSEYIPDAHRRVEEEVCSMCDYRSCSTEVPCRTYKLFFMTFLWGTVAEQTWRN